MMTTRVGDERLGEKKERERVLGAKLKALKFRYKCLLLVGIKQSLKFSNKTLNNNDIVTIKIKIFF